MSLPFNPSGIMIYKIIKDYETSGKTIHAFKDLQLFAKRALDYASSICEEHFWVLQSPIVKQDLLNVCDITNSICELNTEKLNGDGAKFVKIKVGNMPYPVLKGTIKAMHDTSSRKKTDHSIN